jgi:AbrB family looped-hinge helix DNA binding protein
MQTATLTSKGQITLPKKMRDKLHLIPGSKVVFEEQPNGDFVVRRKTIDIRELKGILPKPPRSLTIEEMKDGVGLAVAEQRLDRGR